MSIHQERWDAAIAALEGAPSIALACHVGPDGDALGSMIALGIALRERGKDVVASWGSEPADFSVPRSYAFLPSLDLLTPPDAYPDAPDVMVTFDAGSFDRLGALATHARAARTLIVVDHHASNDDFGHVNLVDPDAAASAVLVFDLLRRLDVALDRDIATCLYTGLVTDTGRFQYQNTTPEIHRMAADLLACGVPHDEITRRIYDTHSMGYLALASEVLSRLKVHTGANMVWSYFTQEDLDRHSVEMEDTESLIDLVRTVDGCDVAAILKEMPDGHYKVSMRSKGETDVGAACEALGGGGHRLAAGFTANGSEPAETVSEIAALLHP